MIRKTIETCPKCGQWQPWRIRSKITKGLGEREAMRQYVRCKRCGYRTVVVWLRPE